MMLALEEYGHLEHLILAWISQLHRIADDV